MKKIIKIGAIALSLATLVACSTQKTAITEVSKVKQIPIICPQTPICRMPLLNFKTNKNLVMGVERLMNTISLCEIRLNAINQCIANYNNNLRKQ
ncbi:Rz1-like lysis system protein LysC [Phocoenobacter skyensis]|uniref:Rz1-like lysis system protein LysC n=1 Tax=Phocoenobacter skyensis TaxID=97481 RepID=UPI003B75CB98